MQLLAAIIKQIEKKYGISISASTCKSINRHFVSILNHRRVAVSVHTREWDHDFIYREGFYDYHDIDMTANISTASCSMHY